MSQNRKTKQKIPCVTGKEQENQTSQRQGTPEIKCPVEAAAVLKPREERRRPEADSDRMMMADLEFCLQVFKDDYVYHHFTMEELVAKQNSTQLTDEEKV